MKKLNGYAQAQAYTETERLPVGGYVLKILGVEYQENSWGDVIVLSFDIIEGEQRGFFLINYENQNTEDKRWKGTYRLRVPKDDGTEQDEWTMRRFKTVIMNFEESNPGYRWDWDEKTLKNLMIGGIFNNKEYEINGHRGFFTNCHSLIEVNRIRSGKFKIPEDTLLKQPTTTKKASDFMTIPDGVEDEGLPFN